MKKSIALLIAVCVVATTVFAACNLQSVQAKIVYMADGKVFEIQEVTSSTDAPIDDEPEKKGYEFVGWYEDEDGRRRFDFDDDDYFASEDKEDVVVYAKFEEADDSEDDPSGGGETALQAEIVYMADGKVFEIQKVTSSTDAPIAETPGKDGYEFVGWYEDEDGRRRFDFDDYFASEIRDDVVVYAKFEKADDSEDAPVGDPDRIDPHWMNGYRVGYIAGNTSNNAIDLSKVFPGGSNFKIGNASLARIRGDTLTTCSEGETVLYYDNAEGAALNVVMHVMDGYTNVDTWDELYDAVMIEGEVANVCVQSDLTAVANKAFAFVPNDSPDYAGFAPSPDTLNLYGNMFTWDTSAITKTGTSLFRIDWCEKTINVTDVYMKGAEPVLDDNGNMDLTQFEGGGAFFSQRAPTTSPPFSTSPIASPRIPKSTSRSDPPRSTSRAASSATARTLWSLRRPSPAPRARSSMSKTACLPTPSSAASSSGALALKMSRAKTIIARSISPALSTSTLGRTANRPS